MATLAVNTGKRLIPLLDRVIIRKSKALEKTAGGILIPEKSQETIHQGHVVAVGPGSKDHKMSLSPGDRVVLPSYGGAEVKLGEESLFIFRENEIPAKFEE